MLPNLSAFTAERQPLAWALALLTGIGAAYPAIAFRVFIGIVQLPWLDTTSERVHEAASALPWWVVLLMPALGGLAVGLYLTFVMPGKRPLGVGDVIEARALLGCRITVQEGIGSALVSAVSLGMGASAGREGPIVHLGAVTAAVLGAPISTTLIVFELTGGTAMTIALLLAVSISSGLSQAILGQSFFHW